MTEKIKTVIFSAKNYFQTSLLTIFENIPSLELMGSFPIHHLPNIDPKIICCDFMVCIIQNHELNPITPTIQHILTINPQQKILMIGVDEKKDFFPKNIIFHTNLTQLSRQTVETYLLRLFDIPTIKINEGNHRKGEIK